MWAYAGDRELFERAVPLLEVMGKKSFFLGDVGKAAKTKLIINMASFVTVEANCGSLKRCAAMQLKSQSGNHHSCTVYLQQF